MHAIPLAVHPRPPQPVGQRDAGPVGRVAGALLPAVSAMVAALILGNVCVAPVAAQTVASKAPRERPVPPAALERASETGGWWMVAQTACDVARGTAILGRINDVLGRIRPPSAGLAVSERVQDPFLPEASRLKMEALMRRVTDLQRIAGDIRGIEGDLALAAKEMKLAPERLDRPEWKLAEPVVGEAGLARLREDTDQTLAKACAESIAQIDARFVDAKTGILPLLR